MSRTINKILIVDDEDDICYLLKNILQRQTEASIHIATSVSEAKGKLNENIYDLTFFDMQLGDGLGIDLINLISESKDQNPYVAVISAYTSSSDLQLIDKLNVDEFIPKPLSREKIIQCYLAATA